MIKEQNMLDAFSLIEFFCQLLLERVKLIAQSKLVVLSILVIKCNIRNSHCRRKPVHVFCIVMVL